MTMIQGVVMVRRGRLVLCLRGMLVGRAGPHPRDIRVLDVMYPSPRTILFRGFGSRGGLILRIAVRLLPFLLCMLFFSVSPSPSLFLTDQAYHQFHSASSVNTPSHEESKDDVTITETTYLFIVQTQKGTVLARLCWTPPNAVRFVHFIYIPGTEHVTERCAHPTVQPRNPMSIHLSI